MAHPTKGHQDHPAAEVKPGKPAEPGDAHHAPEGAHEQVPAALPDSDRHRSEIAGSTPVPDGEQPTPPERPRRG